MKYVIIFSLILFIITGCEDKQSEDNNMIIKKDGIIFGTVTDKDTGMPVKGATVQIGNKTTLTDDNGKYSINEIPFSDNIKVIVTASEYKDYIGTVSLQQELQVLDISITPSQSPSAPILAVLEAISKDIEALDDKKIPDIQSHFSEDYIAGNDEATAFGILAGVIPPTYNEIPNTMKNINNKYVTLTFKFANPEIKFDVDLANVQMQFIVNAETKPPEPKLWDIIVNGKMTFKKQNNEWKMTFWALIPPFLKFEEKPI